MPHAMAVRIGGTKNGNVISTSSAPRAGVLVRAMIHPNSTASASAITVLIREMPTVLANSIAVCQVNTCRYPDRSNVPAIPGGVVCRLP
jgi:hypothetical protein